MTRRELHVTSEALAIVAVAPFLWWAANRTTDRRAEAGLRALAVGTVALDGYLLWSYLRK